MYIANSCLFVLAWQFVDTCVHVVLNDLRTFRQVSLFDRSSDTFELASRNVPDVVKGDGFLYALVMQSSAVEFTDFRT